MIILNEVTIKDLNLTLIEDNKQFIVIEESNHDYNEYEFNTKKQAIKLFNKLSKGNRKGKAHKHDRATKSGF